MAPRPPRLSAPPALRCHEDRQPSSAPPQPPAGPPQGGLPLPLPLHHRLSAAAATAAAAALQQRQHTAPRR